MCYTFCMVLRNVSIGFLVTFLSIGFLLFFTQGVLAHGDEEHNELPSKVSVCHSLSEGLRDECYITLCETGDVNECAEDIVGAAVSGSGPKFALAVLTDLSAAPVLSSSDIYDLAQRIGRLTAEQYGFSGDIFSRCEKDFHYGCYYGFFEAVLVGGNLTVLDAAASICGSLAGSEREMCYHKMGHMFIKYVMDHDAQKLTLESALFWCDSLEAEFESHCWDGVFMERVNEILRGDSLSVDYDGVNVLSPCDVIVKPYREMCYKNHGRYLLRYFDVSDIDAVCAGAGLHAEVCRHSVMDAQSGSEPHHEHADSQVDDVVVYGSDAVYEEKISWFEKIINFVLSLFGFGGQHSGSDMYDAGEHDAMNMAREESLMDISEDASLSVAEPAVEDSDGGDAVAVIVYRDRVYVPDRVEISVGDTVVFVNDSSVFWPASNLHPTHREYPGSNITKCGTPERVNLFDACEAMGPGAEYSFIFNEVGEWGYHDHINPQVQGVVVVLE